MPISSMMIVMLISIHLFGTALGVWRTNKTTWDAQWKRGAWRHLDTVPVERARTAMIGTVLLPMLAPFGANSTVLEFGCGEAAVLDFFPLRQKAKYVGVDISSEVIRIARDRHGPIPRFVTSKAEDFRPPEGERFDIIILSEVLYYIEFEPFLRLNIPRLLSPRGIVILSIFNGVDPNPEKQDILAFVRASYELLEEMKISGFTYGSQPAKKDQPAFFDLVAFAFNRTSSLEP